MPLHHIIPKHAGGTDDPSNLMECTVEEHAELHLALYLEHGRWQDWVAFHAIAGFIKNEDVAREALRLNGMKKRSEETKRKMSESAKLSWANGRDHTPNPNRKSTKGYKHSDEARKKMSIAASNRWRNTSK